MTTDSQRQFDRCSLFAKTLAARLIEGHWNSEIPKTSDPTDALAADWYAGIITALEHMFIEKPMRFLELAATRVYLTPEERKAMLKLVGIYRGKIKVPELKEIERSGTLPGG